MPLDANALRYQPWWQSYRPELRMQWTVHVRMAPTSYFQRPSQGYCTRNLFRTKIIQASPSLSGLGIAALEQRLVSALQRSEQRQLQAYAEVWKEFRALAGGLRTSACRGGSEGGSPPQAYATCGAEPSGATPGAQEAKEPPSGRLQIETDKDVGPRGRGVGEPPPEEGHDECRDNSNPYARDESLETVKEVWSEDVRPANGRRPITMRNVMFPERRTVGKVKRRHDHNQELVWEAIEVVAVAKKISVDDAMLLFHNKQIHNRCSLHAVRKWIKDTKRENKTGDPNDYGRALALDLKCVVHGM